MDSSTLMNGGSDSLYAETPIWDLMFRVIVLGDAEVGKSCIVRAFTEGTFKPSDPTIGVDFAFRVIQVTPTDVVKLQIWDTAGSERFRAITHSYYRNAAGVVLVFDVTSRVSFENIPQWIHEVGEYSGHPHISIVLVGSKVDAIRREVTTEEAELVAKSYQIKYIEVSAKELQNIDVLFQLLASAIYSKYTEGLLSPNAEGSGVSMNSYKNRASHNIHRESVLLGHSHSFKSRTCCRGGSAKADLI